VTRHPDTSGYPLPVPIDDGSRLCVIVRVPNIPGHRQAFIGAVNELCHAYNWGSDEGHNALLAAGVWRVIFDEMMEQFYENDCGENMNCCFIPVLHRVNPTTGRLEISIDGGVIWQPDPDDPIYTTPALPPPVTSGVSATKCDAASNGFSHIQDLIAFQSAKLEQATTGIELVLLIAGELLLLILTAGTTAAVLVPVVIGTGIALFELGKVAYDLYWTVDEKNKILCILFCNIGEDGSFSDAGYNAVLADLGSKLTPGVPRDDMYRNIQAIGKTGLNNLCAYGIAADSDCTDCECSCDITHWEIQIGELIERDETHIKLQCVLYAGSWIAAIHAPTPASKCGFSQPTAEGTGTPVNTWGIVPEAFPEDPRDYPHSTVWGAEQCVNAISVFGFAGQTIDTVTFTISSDCE